MANSEQTTVLVIGGGAAGLMAAGHAAKRGLRVTILERNPRMARKLMITGKGRCNITNNCPTDEIIANIPTNGRFLYSALASFSPESVMRFFESQGLELKTERGNRVFPASDKACDVVDTLVNFVKSAGCRFIQGRAVELLLHDGICTGVRLEDGRALEAQAVIVATGGLSYPLTGSTGDGYTLAQQAGHTIMPPRPSLVPLTSADDWCKDLQGLSLRNCALKLLDTQKGKVIFEDFGEMLFTHFGVSGPMALSASAHMKDMQEGRYRLLVDCKPGLTPEKLDARILRDFEDNKNRDIGNSLFALLPRALCPVALQLCGMDPTTKCHDITRKQRLELGALIKALPITIAGFRPVEEAIVTAGGVKVAEIQSRSMESKLVKGLYFAGEVLDVDAYTGGFNLQIAWSTGYAAGMHAAQEG